MTKREFLKQLRNCLSQLSAEDRDQVLLYWSEAIDDRLEAGLTEEQIFAEMERPDIIALRILSEMHQPAAPAEPVAAKPVEVEADDDDDDGEDDDDDDGDDDEDDEDEDDGRSRGFSWDFRIPEIKIPEIKIPEIKIPEFNIPEINIPERRKEGRWYFGVGDQGAGYYGEDASRLRHRKLEANPDTVRQLQVVDDNNGIELSASPDGKIRILWTENSYHQYDITTEQGVLSLVHQKPGALERMFGISRREKVRVMVPQGYTGGVSLTTRNASIKAESVQLAGPLSLTTRNASIKLEAVQAAQVVGKTANASIKAEELQTGQMSLRSSNGKIALERAVADGAELVTSNGKIELSRVTVDTLRAETSNDAISADHVDARQGLSLVTSNGSISGSLAGQVGDYTIESSTSNGSNRIPSRAGGARRLYVKTSNASIKLSFEG